MAWWRARALYRLRGSGWIRTSPSSWMHKAAVSASSKPPYLFRTPGGLFLLWFFLVLVLFLFLFLFLFLLLVVLAVLVLVLLLVITVIIVIVADISGKSVMHAALNTLTCQPMIHQPHCTCLAIMLLLASRTLTHRYTDTRCTAMFVCTLRMCSAPAGGIQAHVCCLFC